MAQHKSALKRIRSNDVKRVHNKYYHKTMRNALRKFRTSTDVKELETELPKVSSMIDRLTKINVIHKNKANNLKSGMHAHVAAAKA
jgi:small subunit ribosomal protein S20|tara:strand:+ start:522 stop:779 length:258 start_codon:yes stop_codon:yes gene_type:complete